MVYRFIQELRGCKIREYQVFFRQQTGKQYDVGCMKIITDKKYPTTQFTIQQVSPGSIPDALSYACTYRLIL